MTTTTISRKQYEYTRQRVSAAGLADRVTVLCEDYRDLQGSFDKLVSIEMIEAVGHQYFDTYFRVCSDRLKPHGMMLLQAIVIPDQRYDRYRRSTDFIQRYIFPGGCLPSPGAICRSLGRATDLQVYHLEDITAHYAETLAHWRQRFRANLEQVRGLGFLRRVHPHLGVLFLLLRRRVPRADDRRRADAAHQGRVPERGGISGLTRPTGDSRQATSCFPDVTSLPSNTGTCRTAPAGGSRKSSASEDDAANFSAEPLYYPRSRCMGGETLSVEPV